jgi:O-acetyl-ADP-ribose deacetylase (regulator of RNase III)
MIYRIVGDLLKQDKVDIICHQANTKGVMGAGIALQIKRIYPEVYQKYKLYCDQYGSDLLGKTLYVNCNDGKIVANLFGQDGFGRGFCQTDYTALDMALSKLANTANLTQKSVGLPYKMGCGLAGGDWKIVNEIIEKYFGNSKVNCYICSLEGV